MNYKVLLLCAVIGASMQTAQGMEHPIESSIAALNEVTKANEAMDSFNAALDACKEKGISLYDNPEFKDVVSKIMAFCSVNNHLDTMTDQAMISHALQAEDLAKELEVARAAYEVKTKEQQRIEH